MAHCSIRLRVDRRNPVPPVPMRISFRGERFHCLPRAHQLRAGRAPGHASPSRSVTCGPQWRHAATKAACFLRSAFLRRGGAKRDALDAVLAARPLGRSREKPVLRVILAAAHPEAGRVDRVLVAMVLRDSSDAAAHSEELHTTVSGAPPVTGVAPGRVEGRGPRAGGVPSPARTPPTGRRVFQRSEAVAEIRGAADRLPTGPSPVELAPALTNAERSESVLQCPPDPGAEHPVPLRSHGSLAEQRGGLATSGPSPVAGLALASAGGRDRRSRARRALPK